MHWIRTLHSANTIGCKHLILKKTHYLSAFEPVRTTVQLPSWSWLFLLPEDKKGKQDQFQTGEVSPGGLAGIALKWSLHLRVPTWGTDTPGRVSAEVWSGPCAAQPHPQAVQKALMLPAGFPTASRSGPGMNYKGDYLSPLGRIFIAPFWLLWSEGKKRRGFKMMIAQ